MGICGQGVFNYYAPTYLLNSMIPQAASRYTLRKHKATPFVEEAQRRGVRVVNCGIGNPLAFHGLRPFPLFVEEVQKAAADPKSWGYVPSLGLPELREAIQRQWVGHPEVEVFLGAGISDLGDALFRTIFDPHHSVAIPEFSYILYLFHAALSGITVRSVALDPFGSIDANQLEHSIDRDTRMVVAVTTGNPIGTSLSAERFAEIVEVVNRKEREFNQPIVLLADVIYEPFRRSGRPLDPIAIARAHGRIGPTILADSLSKVKIVAPGARVGWIAVDWPTDSFPVWRNEFFPSFTTLRLPSLGTVDSLLQHGLLRLLQRLERESPLRALYRNFEDSHIQEVHHRVSAMLSGLAERGLHDLEFPGSYYNSPGDPSSGVAVDRIANSLYLNFGIPSDQNTPADPFAARLARHGLEHGTVIATTPLSSFVPSDRAAALKDFTRITALCSDPERALFFEALDRFLEKP